jgi:hypothetical protein
MTDEQSSKLRCVFLYLVTVSAAAETPKIIVHPPLAQGLPVRAAVVSFRTENLRIAPVFGPAAVSLAPRVGHLHVNVDDAPWVWAHTSGEPVIVSGLRPGTHRILLQLRNADHQPLDEGSVTFVVPEAIARSQEVQVPLSVNPSHGKIVIEAPLPEPLSRGVVFVRYQVANMNSLLVHGAAALHVSPGMAHIHVRVDETPWYWADASGNPIILQGLASGRHKIVIELMNANDQIIDYGTVEVTMKGESNDKAK